MEILVSDQLTGGRRPYLPRSRRAEVGLPGFVVRERDIALLEDIAQYRWLTTSQLELLRAHDSRPECRFVSRLPLTRRLKLLFHHGYVQRVIRPQAKGSLEPVYLLDSEGVRILSQRHGEVVARPASQVPKQAALEHLLAINQFRVSLTTGCSQRSDCGLIHWHSSEGVKFTTEVLERGERVSKTTIIPDGSFTLRVLNQRLFYFLEVDLGTEPGRTLIHKCRAYFAYWRTGGFARDFSVPAQLGFRVLFVAPSARRVETIRSAIRGLETGRRMFWTTTADNIDPGSLFKAVFDDGDTGERVTITGQGGEA
jgi:hypothetical protein